MKYLKKFNEELKSQTYRNAARKLRKIISEKPVLAKAVGAESRAKNLEDYSKEIENREHLDKWRRNVEKYSKYGEFNFELSRPGSPSIPPKVYPFYIELCSDLDSLIESWDDEDENNRSINFGFAIGLIPKTIEDIKEILQTYNSEFYNGFFFSSWVYVEYRVVNSEVKFLGVRIYDYETPCQIADRKTANSLKRLLVNIFDPKFDYPSGETYITDMYDLIERNSIQGLDIGVTYGIDMQRIKEDLQKLPVINFYKQ